MKVVFTNALKNICRDKMRAVDEYIADLLPFVHSVYCLSSFLSLGSKVLFSSECVHQCDPMGPLLFGFAIHKLCAKMRSEIAKFYLDTGTLGGNKENVNHDIKKFKVEA